MLETRAIVVRTDAQQAWVEARHDTSGCGTCQGKGCGSSKLSQMFCSNKKREFGVDNPIAARAGDEVIVAIGDGAVWQGVLQVYLLPLAGLLLGGALGAWWAQGDLYSVWGGVIGLLAGYFYAKRLGSQHRHAGGRPYIARLWQGS